MTTRRPKVLDILMVDDDPGDIRITQEALKECKIATRLTSCSDGQDALDYLNKRGKYAQAVRPHVIFMDINMPRMNGLEALKLIKADPALAEIPIVILTTSEADRDIHASYKMHANCFVSKPVDLDQFTKVIQDLGEFWSVVAKLP